VLIAQCPNAVVSQLPRLAAHLASAERLQFGGFDALQDGVRPMPMADVEPQTAEFFFDLQDFERAPAPRAVTVSAGKRIRGPW
jgi:hypothetical protein